MTSDEVSASLPNMWQCPPVVVIGVPAAISLGPGIMYLSIASFIGNTTSFLLPRSLMVVTPEQSASLTALVFRCSLWSPVGRHYIQRCNAHENAFQ